VKVHGFWKILQPEGTAEGSLDVTVPMNAIKEKSLNKDRSQPDLRDRSS
jgi:hypothetical protein